MLLKRQVSRGTSEAETFGLPSQPSPTATSTMLEHFRDVLTYELHPSGPKARKPTRCSQRRAVQAWHILGLHEHDMQATHPNNCR